jgi:hypothetical protein
MPLPSSLWEVYLSPYYSQAPDPDSPLGIFNRSPHYNILLDDILNSIIVET